jgi:excisionase family DNA binding protein
MEKLWTTAEVAQFLGVSEIDVEELVRQGKLTGYKLGGKFLRFRPDQVTELKRQIRFRPKSARSKTAPRASWLSLTKEFVYFYDFYVVSAVLLLIVVVYLIAAE